MTNTLTTYAPTKARRLFDIGSDLEALEELIESAAGDISDPAVEATVTAWLQELQTDQGEKADRYVNLLRNWEMMLSAATSEVERYQHLAHVLAKRIASLKEAMKLHMQRTRQQNITTLTGRVIRVQNNGGALPLVISDTVNPQELEGRFQKVTTTVDVESVRKAIESGEKISWAQLLPRGQHLRIL